MPIITDADGSEDVNDFLSRIRDLSRKRDIEDEERTRKLEEDIVQGRKERQARRAERARSISPIKDTASHVGTPNSRRSGKEVSYREDFNSQSSQSLPSSSSAPDDVPCKTGASPTKIIEGAFDTLPRGISYPPSKTQTDPARFQSAPMTPLRAGTLSWQRRPSSRESTGSSKRPLSVVASERNASKSPPATVDCTPENDDKGISRSQIADSLRSKDPTWFKQTQDRGSGSAAFSRSRDDSSGTASMVAIKRLPGISRESTAEPEDRAISALDSGPSASPSREGSLGSISGLGHKYSSSASPASAGGVRSPIPTTNSLRLEPPSTMYPSVGENISIARPLAMSPSQGRLSPGRVDRPASPTKGLGGFVQSAMLKRSDSVNKRWSAQAGPGLSRGNSITGNRSGYEGSRYLVGGVTALKDSRQHITNREHSTEMTSRPGSSHSNASLTQGQIDSERTIHSISLASTQSNPIHDEVSEPATIDDKSPPSKKHDDNDQMMSPPASPNKKWSPTKASWLENAINKTDSPKVISPAPQQPAWMAEINRAKQQRGSIDLSKGGIFKEVATNGLIRSPPPGAGYKPPGISGLPTGFSAGIAVKSRTESPETLDQRHEARKASNDNDSTCQITSPHTLGSESETKHLFRQSPATEKAANSLAARTDDSRPGSHMQSPNAAKLKPETPPKIDFKSTLKSRQASAEAKSQDEPEFKNIFGNLKRTQTQNYKAPDELKDNILRGKAGLAMTENPKKTDRKDAFKESILKKKERMVVPSASTTIASSKTQEHSVPEAIAKRQGLTRSERLLSNSSTGRADEHTKVEALVKLQNLRDKPRPIPPEKPNNAAANAEKDSASKGSLGGEFSSSLAGMLRRGLLTTASSGKPSIAPTSSDDHDLLSNTLPNDEEASSVGPQLKHATKARARGPKRRLPTTSKQYQDLAEDKPKSHREPQSNLSVARSGPPRATLHVTESQIPPPSTLKPELRPLSNITHNNNNNNRKTSQPSSPRKLSTSIVQSLEFTTSSLTAQARGKELQNKPPKVVKEKPTLSPKNTKTPVTGNAIPIPLPDTPLKRAVPKEPLNASSGLVIDVEKHGPAPQELDKSNPSLRGAGSTWESGSMQPSQYRSPIKPPAQRIKEAAHKEAHIKPTAPFKGPIGLGIETPINGPKLSLNGDLPSPITPSPRSPPLSGRKSTSNANRVASANLPIPAIAAPPPSDTMHSTNLSPNNLPWASDLLAKVFDEHPSSDSNINIDTQAVLGSRSFSDSSPKIKTLRRQIFKITDNGKSIPVPSQQEHILLEDSLYVCTHVFGTLAGTRTAEVYLWCGDGVPSSSIEDAQLFAKKIAKDNNGKLIILKQGKETTNFFQALGGIVITRRGSGSRLEPSFGTAAGYILCGRQHVGQIAFDEVDFSPQSLCKGFPYIVSTRSGKVYLWKGRGSGVHELGCARLIGMDLGLTGNIEEIDEDHEPDAFWQFFPEDKRGATISQSAPAWYWHLKPSCEKYTTRLYRIDVEAMRPKSSSGFMQWGRRGSAPADTNGATTAQIGEIVPFVQSDLMDDGVFVLDAFFEVFIILSIRSLAPAPQHKSTESAAFRAALVFAQEYGILAASAEDRPFVPVSSVLICSRSSYSDTKEVVGIPEGMRRAFRKWDDGMGLSDCRVLPLSAALEATGVVRGSGPGTAPS